MTLTLAQPHRQMVSGNRLTVFLTGTFAGSYTGGGEAAPLTDYVSRIDNVDINTNDADDGYILKWDATNNKIQLFEAGADGAALDEASGTIALTCQITIVGGRA